MNNFDIENLKETELLNEFISSSIPDRKQSSKKDLFIEKINRLNNRQKKDFFEAKIHTLPRFTDRYCGMYYHWWSLSETNGELYVLHKSSHEYSPVVNTEKTKFDDFIKEYIDILYE